MIKTNSVIVIGSSGHSTVIIDIFGKMGLNVIGLIDSFRKVGEDTLGYPILGGEEDIPQIISRNENCSFFVAVGDNWSRQKVVSRVILNNPDIEFVSAIHPTAQIGLNVRLGKGVAIMAGGVVNSNSVVEDFTIINTRSSVDHDSKMFQFSSLAPNACTGGNVTIGECTAIGIGATVANKISIGRNTVIGAGSVVLKNIPDHVVAYGVPARVMRTRANDEKYQ